MNGPCRGADAVDISKLGWLLIIVGLGAMLVGGFTGNPAMWFKWGWAGLLIGATIVIVDFL